MFAVYLYPERRITMEDYPVKTSDTKYCSNCGAIIDAKAEICPKCGTKLTPSPYSCNDVIDNHRTWITTLLLCIFFGMFGVHRFYNRKIGTGLLMLFTCGGCGIWYIVDLIMIICGSFTDKEGNLIK